VFKNYYKYFLFIFIILSLFFLNSSFVFALEAKYPPILGLTVTNGSGLEDYVAYFFGFGMVLAGVLAVISFAVGAIRLIMSVENPEAHSDAIDRMKGALLGLVLTVASFMILRTINTSLVTPSLTPLPGVEGVFYTNGKDLKPTPMSEANTDNVPAGYESIIYKCKSGPNLFVWQFPKTNFEGIENTFVKTLKCNESTTISRAGSFKMAFETPGIYYFLKDGCQGYMSDANLSGGQLIEPFKDKVKSIKIINNIPNDMRYGIIFHDSDDPARAGFCTLPFLISDINKNEGCVAGISVSSSADFLVWNAKNPETSGQGIDFYSEPWGLNIGARAGRYSLGNKGADNKYWNYWDEATQNLPLTYKNVNRPISYQQLYQNFSQHPGSINIKGGYFVILTSMIGSNIYCQTFYKDIPNLNETEFVATGNKIEIIDVIPIK